MAAAAARVFLFIFLPRAAAAPQSNSLFLPPQLQHAEDPSEGAVSTIKLLLFVGGILHFFPNNTASFVPSFPKPGRIVLMSLPSFCPLLFL